MSDVLSQLSMVFGSSTKPTNSKLANLGDSPEGQVNSLFADDQGSRNQHEQAGSSPGSFAAALEHESLDEAESNANELRIPKQSRLDSLGVFYAEERPGYSELELGGQLQASELIGKELPDIGDNLPPDGPLLVTPELTSFDDNELLVSVAGSGQSPEENMLSAEANELLNGSPGLSIESDEPVPATDDVFADLAFLPGADQAGASAVKAAVTKEAESKANGVTESDVFMSEELPQRVQNKSHTREQVWLMQASEESGASKAAAHTLNQQQMRRSTSRDVDFEPQRYGLRPGSNIESLEENRSLQFEGQLNRAPTAVEKENLMATVSQAREHSTVSGQSAASQSTQGQASAIAARLDQQNAVNEQPGTDSAERRILDMRLGTTVGKPEWGEHLGRQLTLMIGKSMDQASIQLDPPELGPMQIRLHMQQDQVSLQISAHHAVVRDAVEQSVARLQQLFNEEGLELLQVSVSDEQSSGEGSARHGTQSREGEREENLLPLDDGNLTPMRITDTSDGKIDYFV